MQLAQDSNNKATLCECWSKLRRVHTYAAKPAM